MPTNLYGPGDNFNLENSHVIPAFLRKADEAKRAHAPAMTIWGSGTPRREFLHVDDCADALVFLMQTYSDFGHINVGSGEDQTIDELARLVIKVVGYNGDLVHDTSRPDGTPRKLMSNAKLAAMGWAPKISLAQGLAETYRWFQEQEQIRV
jgi:GDP-L-fucose synthase